MNTTAQKTLALALLDWHGGQSSALYAVGSCMLSDAERARAYDPRKHRGHAGEGGAVDRALRELRELKKSANYPEAVEPRHEAECNRLADEIETITEGIR